MTKPDNYFSGNGLPMESVGPIDVYGSLPGRYGYELLAHDDDYPMMFYGHYRFDRTDECSVLRWSTDFTASQAAIVVQDFARQTGVKNPHYFLDAEVMPSGDVMIDPEEGRVTREMQAEWARSHQVEGLWVVTRDGELSWLLKNNYDDEPCQGSIFRMLMLDSFNLDFLHQVVERTILDAYKREARARADTFQTIFTKYAQLIHPPVNATTS